MTKFYSKSKRESFFLSFFLSYLFTLHFQCNANNVAREVNFVRCH